MKRAERQTVRKRDKPVDHKWQATIPLTKVTAFPMVKVVSQNFGWWPTASDRVGKRDLRWQSSGFWSETDIREGRAGWVERGQQRGSDARIEVDRCRRLPVFDTSVKTYRHELWYGTWMFLNEVVERFRVSFTIRGNCKCWAGQVLNISKQGSFLK